MCADWPDDVQVVAVGKCNHKDICAECILQMVMLYKNSQCPLCKGELDQVLSMLCVLVLQYALDGSLCFSSAAVLIVCILPILINLCRSADSFEAPSLPALMSDSRLTTLHALCRLSSPPG